MRLSHIPLRVVTGAFILNSGLGKRNLDKDSAAGLQSMAVRVFPPFGRMEPEQFGRLISYAETALGTALLVPFLPSRLVGLGLGVFSGSLFTMYLKTPGMTLDDGIRPSQQGTVLAKDIWMLGIAAALVLDRKPKPRGI
jgi:DoxX